MMISFDDPRNHFRIIGINFKEMFYWVGSLEKKKEKKRNRSKFSFRIEYIYDSWSCEMEIERIVLSIRFDPPHHQRSYSSPLNSRIEKC